MDAPTDDGVIVPTMLPMMTGEYISSKYASLRFNSFELAYDQPTSDLRFA
jgi:hypothetical protein